MATRECRTVLFIALLAGLLPAVAASDGDPAESHSRGGGLRLAPEGSEFQVNTYTTYAQINPAVAVAGEGDFVVVWESNGSVGNDTDFTSTQGQRFASDGTAVGGQFQVNTYTTGSSIREAVAAAADGDFVVVWESPGSSGSDTDSYSLLGQRFASDGTTVGRELQIKS